MYGKLKNYISKEETKLALNTKRGKRQLKEKESNGREESQGKVETLSWTFAIETHRSRIRVPSEKSSNCDKLSPRQLHDLQRR